MKIIYIANLRIPTEKAHGYQIAKMCEQFSVAGAEVELLIPTRNNSIKKSLFEFYGLQNKFQICWLKMPDFLRYERILGKFAMYAQWLYFAVKLFFIKIDRNFLIYTRDMAAAWIFSLRGYKICFEAHDWSLRRKGLVPFLFRRVNYIVTTNNFIKKEFIKSGFKGSNILVAPNGIDLDVFGIKSTKNEAIKLLNLESIPEIINKKILLYTGSFKTSGSEKGIKDILKSIKILNDKTIVFLAVGGNQNDINYYNNMAREIKVTEKIFFYERQTQNKLALFQRASDLLLMPFPKMASYEFFMTPLKMFEYLAAGRPIIASDLPSIREILNDRNCIFCRPDDPEDLAKKIKQVLDNPALSEKLSVQAVMDAEQYSWSRRVKNILDFIF